MQENAAHTTIPSNYLHDPTLSWKAKGLLSSMLSLPDSWDYSVENLVGLSADGESATRNAVKELEEHGYLRRKPIREKGKIVRWEYSICGSVARED